MPPADDLRLIQLARLLSLDPETVSADAARTVIASRPHAFATLLFAEAAENDDVTSTEAALDYLETRLAFFGDLIGPDADTAIREAFADRLAAWG